MVTIKGNVIVAPVPRPANPLAVLEKLPGWWRGRAAVRVEEAQAHADHSAERRRNLEIATEYERRAALCGWITNEPGSAMR